MALVFLAFERCIQDRFSGRLELTNRVSRGHVCILDVDLTELLKKLNSSEWEKNWAALSKKRNAFLHEGAAMIGPQEVELAFDLLSGRQRFLRR